MRGRWFARSGLVLGLGVTAGANAYAGGGARPVATLRGTCEAHAADEEAWSKRKTADSIANGDSVHAVGSNGVPMTLADGVEAQLEPDASATIAADVRVPAEHGDKQIRAYRLMLRQGGVSVHVPEAVAGTRGLFIATPWGGQVTVWRGTVHVTRDHDRMLVSVFDGAALVGSKDKWMSIHKGTAAVLTAHDAPDIHHTLIDAPTWNDAGSSPLAVTTDSDPAGLAVAWAPVTSAAGYHLAIATDRDMVHTREELDVASNATSATRALPPGRYFVTVRSVGSDQFLGAPSDIRELRVVGLKLPALSLLSYDNGDKTGRPDLILPAGARASFDDAAGLEVALTEDGVRAPKPETLSFGPATRGVKLGAERAGVAYVRHTASGTVLPIHVERRELRAQVDMTPRGAHWPTDPIFVQVRLSDATHRIDVRNEPVAVRVRVNIDDVQVAWKRDGDILTARINPQPIQTPTVVRVSVSDNAGTEIGAGFVEIEGAPVAPLPQ